MVNLVAFTTSPDREGARIEGARVRPAPHANLLQEFEGCEGEVRALLELVAGEGPSPGSGSGSDTSTQPRYFLLTSASFP